MVHSLSPFFSSHFLFCLFFFSSIFSMYCFFANCFFGAASIDESQGFSGSQPVVFTMYCKMCDYSGK